MEEKIYSVRVIYENKLLLQITGERSTVIETALRVCLENLGIQDGTLSLISKYLK